MCPPTVQQLLSVCLIVQAFLTSLNQIAPCNIFSAAGMPIMGTFFLTTIFFQPVVLNKYAAGWPRRPATRPQPVCLRVVAARRCLLVVMYWLALYMGGRAWELRPRIGEQAEKSDEDKPSVFMYCTSTAIERGWSAVR